jgi:hypothetical protein
MRTPRKLVNALWLWLPLLALAAARLTACATAPNPNAAKYPPRGNNCKVRVYNSAFPGVKEWDDLGVARVDCYLDVGRVQCLKKLQTEACRMGGDLLYDVPKKPMRPTDEGMVYVGHVAHTRGGDAVNEGDAHVDDTPSNADAGPVEPILPAVIPPPDAGRTDGG